LRGEQIGTKGEAHAIELLLALALGVEQIALTSPMPALIADLNALALERDGGQVQDRPLVGLRGHKSRKVVHVDALHHQDDCAGALVVKSGQESVGVPLVRALALRRGEGVRAS